MHFATHPLHILLALVIVWDSTEAVLVPVTTIDAFSDLCSYALLHVFNRGVGSTPYAQRAQQVSRGSTLLGALSYHLLVRALPALAAPAKATVASNEATARPQQILQATIIAVTEITNLAVAISNNSSSRISACSAKPAKSWQQ